MTNLKSQQENISLRLDKFLWCVRFFKTRSAASKACSSGRVKDHHNKRSLKASYNVKVGDVYKITDKQLQVLKLPKTRSKFELAQQCYRIICQQEEDTGENLFFHSYSASKPTKKQRRKITTFLSKYDT